jgi:hypothetical protein
MSCFARRGAGGRGLAPKRHASRRAGACPRSSTIMRGPTAGTGTAQKRGRASPLRQQRGQAPPNSAAEPVPCANSGDRHRPKARRSQSPAPLPPQGAGINRNAYKLLDGKGRLMSPADSRNAINSVLLGRRPQEPAGRAGLPPAYLRKNRMSLFSRGKIPGKTAGCSRQQAVVNHGNLSCLVFQEARCRWIIRWACSICFLPTANPS